MNLYSCKVRLGGSIQHEVLKECVTATEIMLLRRIHGKESVMDVKWVCGWSDERNTVRGVNPETGVGDSYSDDVERERLLSFYPATVEHAGEPVPLVLILFPEGSTLPSVVPGIDIPEKKARTRAAEIDEIRARSKAIGQEKLFDREKAEKMAS